MMAIAIIYSLPPIATFHPLRRFMATGLTSDSTKG
jgi:ABC-type glycerol-3-phosphate transport system permease component